MRTLFLSLLLIAPLSLGGCVYALAAGAVGAAAGAVRGTPTSNAELQPGAKEACSAEAAHYGDVHIIDVQQAGVNRIIVWGTVDNGKVRNSFQCNFGTKITGFKLRAIPAEH